MQKVFNADTGEFEPRIMRAPGNYDSDAVSLTTGQINNEATKTQLHEQEATDINNIVDRFLKSGTLPQIPMPPTLDEFGDVFDFQSAMNTLAAAKYSFMQLPADVRAAFGNDPARFVGQVDAMINEEDPEKLDLNKKNLRALGLTIEPGPVADQTTLGDLLAAIKAQTVPGDTPAPEPSKTAS